MIWTVEQIAQAERIRSRVFVDEAVIAHAAIDVMGSVRGKMFREMSAVAHTFGLELHAGDLEFRERPAEVDQGDPQFTTRVEARWHPTAKEVELQGGPRDGEVMAFRYAGEPISSIEVMAPVNLGDLFASPDEMQPLVETKRVRYTLAGWDESARRWIYRPDA